VTPGTDKVRSYDLDGELLWWLEGMSSITIATPYEDNGLLYISSGYVGDRKARPIYAIRPGANGDISLNEGETSNESICWSQPMGAPYNPSTIVYDGIMYVVYDFGEFGAFNAADGTEVIERQRIPEGRGFTTSPWAYDGKIFCMNEDGKTFVFEAGNANSNCRTRTNSKKTTSAWPHQPSQATGCSSAPANASTPFAIRASANLRIS
jgi:outer membrane protein assembly factor BamB